MIGVDEVGRGALAGPLLVCAARLKKGKKHVKGLRDSKKLTKLQREELFIKIKESYDIGEGWVASNVLDEIGLSRALKCATLLALQQLGTDKDDEIIIDGTVNFCMNTTYEKAKAVIKADATTPAVSAASIYAKVLRDNYMYELDDVFSQYGFLSNVGYGTKKHRLAIAKHGLIKEHRKSFRLSCIDK